MALAGQMPVNRRHAPDPAKDHLSAGAISRRSFLQSITAALGGWAMRGFTTAGAASFPGAPATLQPPSAISVTDPAYGATGDGTTNDREAIQTAIDAAIAAGRPLWIPAPAQFYRIILDPEHDHLLINGDVTIIGENKRSTLLRFTVQTAAAGRNYAGFFVVGGSNVRFAELRIEEDLHQPVEQFEFAGVHFESGGVDHACLVERVDIEGFTHCLYAPSSGVDGGTGELFLAIRDCDLHPWWQYCVAFWTVPQGHKRLHIYDSYLHDNQHSHLVYCHPHNSVHIENSTFDGANSWAFHFQGTEVAGNPDYQRFVGCRFGSRNSRGIITQDRADVQSTVEIRNCLFDGRPSIQIRSDVVIDGCYFTAPHDTGVDEPFVSAYSNAPWQATIRNCIFAPEGNSLPHVDLRLAGIAANVENCQFYHQGSGVILNLGAGATNAYSVTDCLFYNRSDNEAQSVSIEIDDGRTTIDHCRFAGRSVADRGVINLRSTENGPAEDAFCRIDNCTFRELKGGSLVYVLGGTGHSWSGKLAGENDRIVDFQSAKPLLAVDPPEPFHASLAPVPGPAPSGIPAGPTIVLSSNYDTYRVLGSADIATMHWWTADGLSDPLFSGTITLAAETPFALVSGGNIQLSGGAARREVAANTDVRLTYDPLQALWSEA